ncbi:MAG TPA: hypothetical protein VG844_10875 [Terracidiphilus sp.]|nr:hypothetical protein [Terracidiphilus sp.]
MNRDEIRQRLLEHLKQSLVSNQISPGSIQLMGVYHYLAQFYPHPKASVAHRIARELLQEFVNNNLLFIGYGDDQGFPWFTLTAYGVECIKKSELLPFDPNGYLASLQTRVPGLDAVTMTYLREAISTFNREFYLSASVALGVAAEALILRMIDSYIAALTDPQRRTNAEARYEGKQLRAQYGQFKQDFASLRPTLPRDLYGDFETHLDSIFQLIRVTRNDSGHPSGTIPERAVVMANLQAFPYFAKRVLAIEEHFTTNPIA